MKQPTVKLEVTDPDLKNLMKLIKEQFAVEPHTIDYQRVDSLVHATITFKPINQHKEEKKLDEDNTCNVEGCNNSKTSPIKHYCDECHDQIKRLKEETT